MQALTVARSWLFVPGDAERKMAKAVAGPADIVILDLEDAVRPDHKPAARDLVRAMLTATAGRERLWVRINPLDGPDALADLAAVMPARPGGVMLPKARGRDDVDRLDHYLAAFEAAAAVAVGTTRVAALVTETAEAMFTTGGYRGAARLAAMTWGAEDLAAALGASDNRAADGGYAFTYQLARSLCLIGAATAGVVPVETIHGDFGDLDGLRARAEAARRDGFRGMLAIHPAQVEVINAAFAPGADEIAAAAAICELFAADPASGAIGVGGTMLDRPHLARAEAVLRAAGQRVSRTPP